eukprot:331392-Chlamydomonas_euryale.AAC.19
MQEDEDMITGTAMRSVPYTITNMKGSERKGHSDKRVLKQPALVACMRLLPLCHRRTITEPPAATAPAGCAATHVCDVFAACVAVSRATAAAATANAAAAAPAAATHVCISTHVAWAGSAAAAAAAAAFNA